MLRALVAAAEPLTIAALTGVLGGHPNTVRVQLDHLVAAGFVAELPLTSTGRGRPARGYAATIAGEQVAGEDDDRDDHTALVEAIAEHLTHAPDPVGAATSLGRRWGRRIAARSEGGGLIEALAGQGFTPVVGEDGVALRTCPLLESARELPEIVCSMHQGMIDVLSPEPMRLRPFAVPGACLLSPEPAA